MEGLVVAGHGSHLNPDSSTPVFQHADAIRELGVFAEVREAFWKEEPSYREVLRTLESGVVYVVPLFMSEGYFTDRVIPRELRITGDASLDVDKAVHYTAPVGTHAAMTGVILNRAEAVSKDPDVGEEYGLCIVGHGTERHDTSGGSARYHAARIRRLERFDEVRALFMDEEPFIGDLTGHFWSRKVIVVPFFVAEGYHTREDLPVMLGLTGDHREGFDTPAEVGEYRVWYAAPVGTDPRMATVILERAIDAGATVDSRPRLPGYPQGNTG